MDVSPVPQPGGVQPTVLRVLQGSQWKGLPLQPATSNPRGFGLCKYSPKSEGYLATIICEAEEFFEDLIETVEGRPDCDRRGRRIKLNFPPNGLQPLLLQIELDGGGTPGTVHVFDIVQTETSGRRGSIRIGAVVVP